MIDYDASAAQATGTAVNLAALDDLPALEESRARLLDAATRDRPVAYLVGAVEADPALTLAVLRLANRGRRAGSTGSVAAAVAGLPRPTFAALARSAPTAEMIEHGRASRPASFRRHALAVRALTEHLAVALDPSAADAAGTLAVIHDIGKLAIDMPATTANGLTPEERIGAERRAGIPTHPEIGAAVARKMNLPDSLAEAIEHHHDAEDGIAAIVRLADMLVHYANDDPIDVDALGRVGRGVGIDRSGLSELMYRLPDPLPTARRRVEDSPLSAREAEILRLLAAGMTVKQVAHELAIAPSTIRNHLHRVYGRIGAADRAQAILRASDQGWI